MKIGLSKKVGGLSFLIVDLTSTSSTGYTNHTWMIEGNCTGLRKHLEHLARFRDISHPKEMNSSTGPQEFFEETSARNKGIKTKIFFYLVGG